VQGATAAFRAAWENGKELIESKLVEAMQAVIQKKESDYAGRSASSSHYQPGSDIAPQQDAGPGVGGHEGLKPPMCLK
jgi:hypothetical protein